MRFLSTRARGRGASLEDALRQPLAPDGGLYVPDRLPRFDPATSGDCNGLPAIAARMLAPFFADSALRDALPAMAAEALGIPALLVRLEPHTDAWLLELHHGPTAAFKDFGAQFLAACLARLPAPRRTILVATSGDTGSAVAAAFHAQPRTRVLVLYPEGGVSPRQERQLTCWGESVDALRVRGSFDDCQTLVKAAFADGRLNAEHGLASANSINLGRLLPQMSYYASASLELWRTRGRRASFIVPAGNLGNALACVWGRAMGLPIDRIVLATNANRTITDFLSSGRWMPRPSVATLASAMDVGNPGNMARLLAFAGDVAGVRREVSAQSVDDEAIRAEIAATFQETGRPCCPHTATALRVLRGLSQEERNDREWVAVATAHPAKFERIVEPIIGRAVEIPPALAELLQRPSRSESIEPRLEALAAVLNRKGMS